MTDTITLSNRRLVDAREGYNELLYEVAGTNPQTGGPAFKARTFPSAIARQRVTFQADCLEPFIKAFNAGLEDLEEERKTMQAMAEGDEKLAAAKAWVAKYNAYLEATVEVPKPRKKLVEADLPKGPKGEDANAAAVLKLRPEFFDLTDPDADAE